MSRKTQIWPELPFEWESVPISSLSEDPESGYQWTDYALRKLDVLPTEVIQLLFRLQPVLVRKRRNKYSVVLGARLYDIAARSLRQTDFVDVAVMKKPLSPEHLRLLRYIDVMVFPFLSTMDGNAADWYQHIQRDTELASSIWTPKSMRDFALALGRSPSALCQPSSVGKMKKEGRGDVLGCDNIPTGERPPLSSTDVGESTSSLKNVQQ